MAKTFFTDKIADQVGLLLLLRVCATYVSLHNRSRMPFSMPASRTTPGPRLLARLPQRPAWCGRCLRNLWLTLTSGCAIQIMVFGEITTRSPLDYQKIIRETIKEIGYDSSDKGFDYKSAYLQFEFQTGSCLTPLRSPQRPCRH